MLPTFVLLERAGLQIALIGLLSPQALKVINPVKNPALNIDDPHLVLKNVPYLVAAFMMSVYSLAGLNSGTYRLVCSVC